MSNRAISSFLLGLCAFFLCRLPAASTAPLPDRCSDLYLELFGPKLLPYVEQDGGGIARVRRRNSFYYLYSNGRPVTEDRAIERAARLGVPPAYRRVWITGHPRAKLQAVAVDANGNRHYYYHPNWVDQRDREKYGELLPFGRALPNIRKIVSRDLGGSGFKKERILAGMVRLLDRSAIRVGNEESAEERGTYGLSTLEKRHVSLRGDRLQLAFVGKSGVPHEIEVEDARLAELIGELMETPGDRLFQYMDTRGHWRPAGADEVNDYIRAEGGREFSAKVFRTWAATVVSATALSRCSETESDAERRLNISEAIGSAAEHLGNSPTVCRKSYVHPGILEAYLDGVDFAELFRSSQRTPGLTLPEAATLDLLEAQGTNR